MLNKLKSFYLWVSFGLVKFFVKLLLKLIQFNLNLKGIDASKFELINKSTEVYNKEALENFAKNLVKFDRYDYSQDFDQIEFLKNKFGLTEGQLYQITDLSKIDDSDKMKKFNDLFKTVKEFKFGSDSDAQDKKCDQCKNPDHDGLCHCESSLEKTEAAEPVVESGFIKNGDK